MDRGKTSVGGFENESFYPEFTSVELSDEPHNEVAVDVGDEQNLTPQKRKNVDSKAITFAWKNVNVFSKPKKRAFGFLSRGKQPEVKQILKNVNGLVRPGELLALMGASGSGKTTLLNSLTFRNTRKITVEGDIYANGRRVGPDHLTAISAYVQQQDLFIGTLTVREVLAFQATLKMDNHIRKEDRMERVEEVLKELGLSKCADVLVGVPGRTKGISGGEMKRLAFGCEVLTDPPLLFCDEPTSGLDSFMAENVVTVLKSQVEKGKTIIATIHQPSSEVFALFDRIMLLAEGRVAFLGGAQEAHAFFSQLNYPCPPNFNPADYFIHTLAVVPGREAECRERVKRFGDAFETSNEGIEIQTLVSNGGLPKGVTPNEANSHYIDRLQVDKKKSGIYRASWGTQFAAVLARSAKTLIREPLILKIRLVQTIVIALILGLIYLQQDMDQKGVQNVNGVIFLLLTNMSFSNMFAVVNVFCEEVPVFLREHYNGMYRTDTYFVGKILAELPLFVVLPIVFSSIEYWMIGLNPDFGRFLIHVLVVVLVANIACSFGYMISTLASSVGAALSIAPPILIPLMLFGGFFLNTTSIPVYLEWMKWLSWFNYAFELLAIAQWQGVKEIGCDIPVLIPSNETEPIPSVCQGFSNGNAVLSYFKFSEDHTGRNVGCLVALLLGYRIMAYLLLVNRTNRQR